MDMSVYFPNIDIAIDFLPRAIYIMGIQIPIYGILICAGMLLALAFTVLEAKRQHENTNHYLETMIVALIGGLIGARLCYVLFSWGLYRGNIAQILNIRNGGMTIYGGLLGGVVFAMVYCRLRKFSFWKMADIAVPGILIVQFVGRWGDFFNRSSFGEYTDSLLAMQLPLSTVRAEEVTALMRENLQSVDGISYIQVHPTFLYESLWCLLLFLILTAIGRRKKFAGENFMRYLCGYAFCRMFTEWLRTDKLMIPGTNISVSLVVSVILFVYFGITVIIRRVMAKKRADFRRRRREERYESRKEEAPDPDDEEWKEILKAAQTSRIERAENPKEQTGAEKIKAPETSAASELPEEPKTPEDPEGTDERKPAGHPEEQEAPEERERAETPETSENSEITENAEAEKTE